METTELLNLKTTNINVRISPILKSQLIEKGSRMGVNLSDYIGHVLTKDMTRQNDPKLSDEYKDLMLKAKRLQNELARYQAVVEPLITDWLYRDLTNNGKSIRFDDPVELLQFIVNTFKIRS